MILSTVLFLATQHAYPTPSDRELVASVSSRAQALSPDGNELAFTVQDGSIGFLALESDSVRLRVGDVSKWMDGIAWSPEGKSLAVACEGERVRIVRTSDGVIESEFTGSPASKLALWWARDLSFVDGGKKLVLCGGSAPAQLRARDGALIADLSLDKECVSSVSAVTQDGKRFAVGDTHGNVGVWAADDGKQVRSPLRVPIKVNCLAFDPTGRRLAVGGGDCTVRVFDIGSDAAPIALSHCDEDIFGGLETGCVAFSPDGMQLLATSFSFHEVRSWNLASHSLAWKFDYGGGNPGGVSAHFSPDGKVVFASRGGEVHAVEDGKLVRRLGGEASLAAGNSFGFDRGRAWNQHDGVLSVFEIAEGKLLAAVSLSRLHEK
jgi:WD40 repeat protein